MKIHIDECLPAGLRGTLAALGHECQTARKAGFGSKKNGELLRLAEGRWDVLLTDDQKYQIPTEHGGTQCCDPDSSREIESDGGFIAADAGLFRCSSFY